MVIWKAFPHFHSDRLCKFGWRFPNQWVHLQPEMLGDMCWPCLYRNGPISSRGPRKLEDNKAAVEQMLKRREAAKRRQWGAKSPVWEKGSGCREVLIFPSKSWLQKKWESLVHDTQALLAELYQEKNIYWNIFFFNYLFEWHKPCQQRDSCIYTEGVAGLSVSIKGVIFFMLVTETALSTTLYNLDLAWELSRLSSNCRALGILEWTPLLLAKK